MNLNEIKIMIEKYAEHINTKIESKQFFKNVIKPIICVSTISETDEQHKENIAYCDYLYSLNKHWKVSEDELFFMEKSLPIADIDEHIKFLKNRVVELTKKNNGIRNDSVRHYESLIMLYKSIEPIKQLLLSLLKPLEHKQLDKRGKFNGFEFTAKEFEITKPKSKIEMIKEDDTISDEEKEKLLNLKKELNKKQVKIFCPKCKTKVIVSKYRIKEIQPTKNSNNQNCRYAIVSMCPIHKNTISVFVSKKILEGIKN